MESGRDIPGPVGALTAAALRAIHTPRCVRATIMLALLLSYPAPAAPADDLPDPAAAVEGFRRVRAWLDEFATPEMDDEASRVAIDRASGVCVILRQSGRVVGMGEDAAGDDLMVRRAAGRAMAQVLADPAFASLRGAPGADDQPTVRERFTATLGSSLVLEFEVAGPLVPLVGRSFDDLARRIEPGLDGIALRHENNRLLRFASQMRATNTAGNVAGHLPGLALELGLSAQTVVDLLGRDRLTVYAFPTIHLVQTAPGAPPHTTFRGDALIRAQQVSHAAIIALADGIAEHLARSQVREVAPDLPPEAPGGLMGDYRPASGDHHPMLAQPLDQALSACALGRYSKAPGVEQARAEAAVELAMTILRELATVAQSEPDPLAHPATCAAIILAASELDERPLDPSAAGLRSAARNRLVNHVATPGEVDAAAREDATAALSPHDHALIAASTARLLARGDGSIETAAAREAIDRAWSSAPSEQHVSLLPWIAMAEIDFANATGADVEHVDRMEALRDGLHTTQITAATSLRVPDLHGGFQLGPRGSDGGTVATAQSSRPAAYLALALRDSRITSPGRTMLDLARTLTAMRFLMQLQVREESVWWARNPSRALGGLRVAPWDSEQPVAAQAMGLLAAAETLISLDALARVDDR